MKHKDRIARLNKQLKPLAGGKVETWISDDMPADMAEQFCRDVVAFETAPTVTNFQQLTDAGIALPNPDEVSDAAIGPTLWTVIRGLAKLRVFLKWTNHLSDRALYEVLWKNVLREEIPILPKSSRGAWHVDLPGDDPDAQFYLKHYAGEKERKLWHKDFPECHIPAHEDPPHDRDRHLPTPDENDVWH